MLNEVTMMEGLGTAWWSCGFDRKTTGT